MWTREFDDSNKKQGKKIDRLSQEYKEQLERLGIATTELPLPAGSVPHGQSPIELLTPRELSQTLEGHVPTCTSREKTPDPSDTLGSSKRHPGTIR